MKARRRHIKFLIAVCFFSTELWSTCGEVVTRPTLRILTYNVLDLHHYHPRNAPKAGQRGFGRPRKKGYEFAAIGNTLKDANPDIAVLQEIINYPAIVRLRNESLKTHQIFFDPGENENGKDTAVLVRRNPDWRIETRFLPAGTWRNPLSPGELSPIFHRKIPVFIFRTKDTAQPFLVLYALHLKSKRSQSKEDPLSEKWRTAQVEHLVKLLGYTFQEFGKNTPVAFAGDFNGEVYKEALYQPLLQTAELRDAFDLTQNKIEPHQRYTHIYYGESSPVHAQLDGILLSPVLHNRVKNARIIRPEVKVSDHDPVVVDLE